MNKIAIPNPYSARPPIDQQAIFINLSPWPIFVFVSKIFFDARYEGSMVPLSLRICLELSKSPSRFLILKKKNKTTICFSYSAHVNYFSSTSSRSTFSFSYYFLSYFWFMRHMLCAPLLRFLLRMLLKMSRDPC